MFKKIVIGAIVVIISFIGIKAVSAYTINHFNDTNLIHHQKCSNCQNYIDENGDGLCDNCINQNSGAFKNHNHHHHGHN